MLATNVAVHGRHRLVQPGGVAILMDGADWMRAVKSRTMLGARSIENPESSPQRRRLSGLPVLPYSLARMETGLMGAFKDSDDFSERLSTAAKARQATLERFRARPRADDPSAVERQVARLATSQAREARKAARAAETARVEEEAIRKTAEDAARKAAAEVEKAAQEATLEAERKAGRDARYAARKARQR
jgi:Family of unknown function (DUF6481)